MFFLGAGFMLVETKAVVHMALLFGGTWIVNSVVIFAVLVMILIANLFVAIARPERLAFYYVALLASLVVSALVPMDTFLGMERTAQIAAASILAFTPIFFAGVVFAVSFTSAVEPDRAFGANIAGAMFGGLAEYSSMLLGFQYLLFVAVALYIISIVGYQKVVTGTPAAHIGHDAGGVVRRRLVFHQRHVRHVEADARFAAIDDLHGADHRAARRGDQVRASLERRPRVPHIVHDQHALALHARRVERAERRPAFLIAKRRKRVRRLRHRPAAVEQARHGVRQQRAAGRRAGDDLRVWSTRSAGITSIRSCATRQIVDGNWNSWCGFRYSLPWKPLP